MEENSIAAKKRQAILSALAWFDVFDFPLTAVEAAKYAALFGASASVAEVFQTFATEPRVQQSYGYYHFSGRADNYASRQKRFRLAISKLRRARLAARLFGWLPFVRLVMVCNSLATANAEEGSDIDFFIICRRGRVWLTRLLLAVPISLLGLRPTPSTQRDKLCLSFFVSEDALDLSRFQLVGDDPYLRFWVMTVAPLYDEGGVFEMFRKANRWIFEKASVSSSDTIAADLLEKAARFLQQQIFPEVIKSIANRDSRVVISDDVLKFHLNDRRELYRDAFRERLRSL